MSATLQLNLPLLLSNIDGEDQCIGCLTAWLGAVKGIEYAHVIAGDGMARLCLHYDPDMLTLSRVRRLAEEAGAAFSDRYRHESLPFVGLDAADAAMTLAQAVERLPGVLHVQVNYAAGLAFVAYDSTMVQRPAIEHTMRQMGAKVLLPAPTRTQPAEHAHDGHDHGSAPAFLPHWAQDRWMLILVILAGSLVLVGWAGENFLGMPPSVALVCFILAYIAGGYDVATHAIPGLFKGKFDTDVLMLAAAAGAAILGEWAEGAFLLFLFSLAHAGEHYALGRARNAINALGELMPRTALVRRGDQITTIDIDQIQLDEVVVVRPGDRFPVDGTVASGSSMVDQSPITGESMPAQKQAGDPVFAGTINQDATLDVAVTHLPGDTTLSRVMKLVAEAQSQHSPTQRFTERFAAWFVPAVLLACILVITIPPLIGWMPLSQSFYRGMLLLVAASPCALVLGTPAAVLAGIAQAARNGVLIKGGVHLENLGGLKVMAFDKTGTLTEGRFSVTDVVPLNGTAPEDLLQVAAAVEQQSNHPLAQAVVRAAHASQLALPGTEGLENVAGRGVRSTVAGDPVLIGTLKLFHETDGPAPDATVVQTVERLERAGRTTMVISRNGRFLGVLGLADIPRPGVAQTMQRLQTLGLRHLVMLTGDNDDVARRIAQEVGVTDVRARLLPEDKLAAIRQLHQQHGAIAMTGDGVNDAPALATATVGIAMGGAGTAVALETADVALMGDDLSKLPFAVGLSRASRAIIRQNLGVSLGVIGLLLVTSVLGLVQLSWAVVLHEGSTIVVVLNALRLLGYHER